jgi:hypothetical protein
VSPSGPQYFRAACNFYECDAVAAHARQERGQEHGDRE